MLSFLSVLRALCSVRGQLAAYMWRSGRLLSAAVRVHVPAHFAADGAQKFVEIQTPKLLGGASEGGSNVFT